MIQMGRILFCDSRKGKRTSAASSINSVQYLTVSSFGDRVQLCEHRTREMMAALETSRSEELLKMQQQASPKHAHIC